MYLKVWKFRLYVKVQARIVRRQGKTRHAQSMAKVAKVANYQYAIKWLSINAPGYHHSDTIAIVARKLAAR